MFISKKDILSKEAKIFRAFADSSLAIRKRASKTFC